MKTSYTNPQISFISIESADVIRTSGGLPIDEVIRLTQGEHARVDNLE